jgi:hypothetical protein
MQPGDAVSTNLVRASSIQGTLMDITAPATGIPIETPGAPGQLVFMPDLPSTVALWHGQRFIMLVWLVSSLVSLVLFAPLFLASTGFLSAEIAAVMGIVAAVVQLCEKELASSNSERGSCWPAGAAPEKHCCFVLVPAMERFRSYMATTSAVFN